MEKIIQLPNRYRDVHNYLEFIEEKENLIYYKLVIPDEETNWLRMIADDSGSFETPSAIDPSGGPFMGIDHYTTEHMVLKKILNRKGCSIIMIFEDEEKQKD